MKGDLFVVIDTPDSGSLDILKHAISETESSPKTCFLLPDLLKHKNLIQSNWKWDKNCFQFENQATFDEWFLVLSDQFNLADQIEALLNLLKSEPNLKLIRVLSFINAEILDLDNKEFQKWLDGCAHFSDFLCFTNRSNENSNKISATQERYKNMFYPMQTMILGSKKNPPINQILAPISLRISHVFDHSDILEPDDCPENDPYLSNKSNNERNNPIPLFSQLFS